MQDQVPPEAALPLEAAMSLARSELKGGHPTRAWKLLLPYKDEAWDDGDYLSLLGISYCMSGHLQEGLEVLERELSVAPSASVHYNLGQAHQMAGDLEKAKIAYRHAQALDSTDQHVVQALQKISDLEKRHEEAEAAGLDAQTHPHDANHKFAATGSGAVFHGNATTASAPGSAQSAPPPPSPGMSSASAPDASLQSAPPANSSLQIAASKGRAQALLYGAAIGAVFSILTYVALVMLIDVPLSVAFGGPPGTANFLLGVLVAAIQGVIVGLIAAETGQRTAEDAKRLSATVLSSALGMLVLAAVITVFRQFEVLPIVFALAAAGGFGVLSGYFIARINESAPTIS